MKTLNQIVLPIAFLGGLVFAITYFLNYTSSPPAAEGTSAASTKPALKFWETLGSRPAEKDSDPKRSTAPQLKFWRDDYELGESGHFDFWFLNENPQPVTLGFAEASCQCASAQICFIPPEAWTEHAKNAQPTNPGGLIPHPVLTDKTHFPDLPNKFSDDKIQQSLHWESLERKHETTVPAATQVGPQTGIIRINWTGKEPEGRKNVKAKFTTKLPNANASDATFTVEFNVVPPFDVYSKQMHDKKIDLGEVSAAKDGKADFYIWSRTRPELHIVLSADSLGDSKDCVSLSSPAPLTEAETATIFGPSSADTVRSAYKATLTVHEHNEIERDGKKITKRLDIGPIAFSIGIATGEGKGMNVPVIGVVRGEMRIEGGNSPNRIDFGSSLRSSQANSQRIRLVGDRADFDLEVAPGESTPDYLQVSLKPVAGNGNKAWTLVVTIPANTLFGNLVDSFVVLRVNDGSNRRIRIPLTAKSFAD